jgi:hypothetical protein
MFIDDDTRKRLIDIVKGTVLEGKEDNCTAARNLLCTSFRTSTTVKKDFEGQFRIKKEQAEFLRHYPFCTTGAKLIPYGGGGPGHDNTLAVLRGYFFW